MRMDELISTSTYPYHKYIIHTIRVNDDVIDVIYKFDADGIGFIVKFEYSVRFSYFVSFETAVQRDEFIPPKEKNVFKIFGTIEKIVHEFLDEVKPDYLMWSGDEKRKSIYRRFKHPDYSRRTDRPGLVRK